MCEREREREREGEKGNFDVNYPTENDSGGQISPRFLLPNFI